MSPRTALAVASAIVALAGAAAYAASPVFAGEHGQGLCARCVGVESGPFTDGTQRSFGELKADFMAKCDIIVTPNDVYFGPSVAVWYGIETDTANYFDMVSSPLNTKFGASADGIGLLGRGGAGDPVASAS